MSVAALVEGAKAVCKTKLMLRASSGDSADLLKLMEWGATLVLDAAAPAAEPAKKASSRKRKVCCCIAVVIGIKDDSGCLL